MKTKNPLSARVSNQRAFCRGRCVCSACCLGGGRRGGRHLSGDETICKGRCGVCSARCLGGGRRGRSGLITIAVITIVVVIVIVIIIVIVIVIAAVIIARARARASGVIFTRTALRREVVCSLVGLM